ncbi:hypothetical protein SLEP1_g53298 [Rubroshorea leprosula]|uniref:Uncharacterized protein n=1 Tax=Rubroshorea leprosula TaxID=152421 RepID=A0AAV5MA43_9ROSI|nr:hypothetical protein SLEP1_g53298 [Rubroshorea leprosula]
MAHPCMLAWTYHNLEEVYLIFGSNQLCLQQMPNLALLLATQQSGMEMTLLRIDLGLGHYSASNCAERRGGLTLFLKDELNLQVSSFSPLIDLALASLFCEQLCREKLSHIDVVIVDLGGCQWPLIGFSSQPETVSPLFWLHLGDINATLSKSEKERGILIFRLGST